MSSRRCADVYSCVCYSILCQIEADSHDLVGDMQLLQGDFRHCAKSFEASLALWLQLMNVSRIAVTAYKVRGDCGSLLVCVCVDSIANCKQQAAFCHVHEPEPPPVEVLKGLVSEKALENAKKTEGACIHVS